MDALSSTLGGMLETIEVETAPKPDAAIIWLHGLGADGHDFEPIVPELVARGERAWRFVFPNAPVRPVTWNGGMRMRAWYDIKGLDRGAAEDVAGFREADAEIRQLIAREVARSIQASMYSCSDWPAIAARWRRIAWASSGTFLI